VQTRLSARPAAVPGARCPPGFAVDFIVEVLDPAEQRWSWRARVLLVGVRLHLEHGVHDDRIGVRTWLRIRGPAWVVLAYAPVAQCSDSGHGKLPGDGHLAARWRT